MLSLNPEFIEWAKKYVSQQFNRELETVTVVTPEYTHKNRNAMKGDSMWVTITW